MTKRFKSRLVTGLPIIFLFCFTFLFYGPVSLYLNNYQELWFRLSSILRVTIPVSLIALVLLTAVNLFLPSKPRKVFNRLLFGVSLGMYVQANLIGISYGKGVLDGSAIDWSTYDKVAIINTGVWLACIALPFVWDGLRARLGKLKLFSLRTPVIMIVVSIFLTVIQVPALVSELAAYHPQERFEITTSDIFVHSPQKNVVVFVMDTMDHAYWQRYLERHPEYVNELTGFTDYTNTLAAGARTIIAMPAMFTGSPFTRQEDYSAYKDRVWSADNVLSLYHEAGYNVSVYSESELYSPVMTDYVSNFSRVDQDNVASYGLLAQRLYTLTSFKYMPHLAKRFFEIQTSDFTDCQSEKGYRCNNDFFVSQYEEAGGVQVSQSDQPVMKVYHINGAHTPFRSDEYGHYAAKSNEARAIDGCFHVFANYLQSLRDQGLYDSTEIILCADHGIENQAEWPIFLVKPAGADSPYTVSEAPASLFDLPVYLLELIGQTPASNDYGCRLQDLTADTKRIRHFFRNVSDSSRVTVNEFQLDGTLGKDELQLLQMHKDAQDGSAPYTLGTTLSFAEEATGNRYCVEGFGINSGFCTLSYGPQITLRLPLASVPDHDRLTAHVSLNNPKYPAFTGNLTKLNEDIAIYANGQKVAQIQTTEEVRRNGLDFTIPASVLDREDPVLELTFVDEKIENPEEQMSLPVTERSRVCSFVSMTIN